MNFVGGHLATVWNRPEKKGSGKGGMTPSPDGIMGATESNSDLLLQESVTYFSPLFK